MRPVEMYEAVWEKSLALNVLQANKNGYERGLEAWIGKAMIPLTKGGKRHETTWTKDWMERKGPDLGVVGCRDLVYPGRNWLDPQTQLDLRSDCDSLNVTSLHARSSEVAVYSCRRTPHLACGGNSYVAGRHSPQTSTCFEIPTRGPLSLLSRVNSLSQHLHVFSPYHFQLHPSRAERQ